MLADAAGMIWVWVGTGLIAGLMLSVGLVGIPRAEHPPIIGPVSLDYLDLAAQRSMSDAAWWMVIITGFSTCVGGLGLYLIARTLLETRKAAQATQQGANASETAVRPFLLVEFAKAAIDRDALVISYKVKNSGVSPAYRAAFRVTLLVTSIDGTKRHERTSTKSRSDIAAGAERTATARFDKMLAADVSDDHGDLLVRAEITLLYSDIFGREHSEASRYGRGLSYFGLDETKSLYRDVGKDIGWGDRHH